MPIDIDQLNLSGEPIPGLDELQDSWKPQSEFPPLLPAGTYEFQLAKVRDVLRKGGEDPASQRIEAVLDFKVVNHQKYQGRLVTFQRVNNTEFMTKDRGRTSFLLDLIKSAGVTIRLQSNRDFVQVLNEMENNGTVFRGQLDWEGYCKTCRREALMEMTGASTYEEANNMRDTLTDEQRKEFYKTGSLHYRDFPTEQDGETRRETVECPTCGEEIKARPRVTRYFVPRKANHKVNF